MRREMNKLMAAVSGIAIFAFLTVLPLWRGCIYSPNAKFSAVIYSLPGFGPVCCDNCSDRAHKEKARRLRAGPAFRAVQMNALEV